MVAVQISHGPQTAPHSPQLCASLLTSEHAPAQHSVTAWSVASAQARPHAPQFFESLNGSTQAPPQHTAGKVT